MQHYELLYLVTTEIPENELQKIQSEISGFITQQGGKIGKDEQLGRRKLAYPINKQEHGIYVFYTLELPADGPHKLERALNITDEIIRFMITRPDLKAAAKAEALKAEKAAKAAANPDISDDEKTDKQSEPRQYRRGKAAEPTEVEKPVKAESDEE